MGLDIKFTAAIIFMFLAFLIVLKLVYADDAKK
jgi:hypothetical protein